LELEQQAWDAANLEPSRFMNPAGAQPEPTALQRSVFMKHKKKRSGDLSARPRLVPVRFEIIQPAATAVCVAGTFNNWLPQANALHPVGNGRWLEETALAPGIYEYCLVVDGLWISDPLAKETVPNPFGGRNSLLTVASPLDVAHLVEAEQASLTRGNDE